MPSLRSSCGCLGACKPPRDLGDRRCARARADTGSRDRVQLHMKFAAIIREISQIPMPCLHYVRSPRCLFTFLVKFAFRPVGVAERRGSGSRGFFVAWVHTRGSQPLGAQALVPFPCLVWLDECHAWRFELSPRCLPP